jgi:hypothetical protein
MKKVFVKMSLMAVLLFSGMMLVSNSAQAQTGTMVSAQQSEIKTSATFLNSSDAMNTLLLEIQNREVLLTQLAEGSFEATVAKTEHSLYSNVYESILAGDSVPKALRTRFGEMAPGYDGAPASPLSANDWQGIYNHLLDILSN